MRYLATHAAAIQAVSAVVIAVLTGVLVWATTRYVGLTKRLAESAERQISWIEGAERRQAADRLIRAVTDLTGVAAKILTADPDPGAGVELLNGLLGVRALFNSEVSLLPEVTFEFFDRAEAVVSAAVDEFVASRLTQAQMANAVNYALGALSGQLGIVRRGQTPSGKTSLPKQENAIAWVHEHRDA